MSQQHKKVRKAVFPVAGLGTRFLPATKAVPKEMLTVVDRPVIQHVVDEARAAGAEILSGGTSIGESCFACTVLFQPPEGARVSSEEIFGPVVCVYPYDEIDEAIERANRLPFAFQAAVFTRHLDTALRVFRRIDASAVMVNDHTAFRVDGMPFAGLRESGLGVGGIPHTIADMQIEKMLVIKSEELG